ncbi:MAG: Ppx/GppA family phosphatase [Hellea sp.]|nr:Ppx/GppA family phosphatase [Hellea sp.]
MEQQNRKYQRVGVLDIGSNSVRFVIYELFGGAFTPVYNEKVLAGLGRDLSTTGRLSPSGKKEALAALKRFDIIAKTQKLDQVLVGATAAMRDAQDAPELIRLVERETGIDIQPLSGQEEAYVTAQGLIAAEPRASGIAADLGGASLELIQIEKGEVKNGISYPIGPFRIAGEDLSRESDFNIDRMRDQIFDHLGKSPANLRKGRTLYLIGGAWRNLAGVHQKRHLYPMKTLQAYQLMPGAARDLARWAYGDGRQDLLVWPGINQRRAETLPYSGLLLDILLDQLEPSYIRISTTGLREGLVRNHMSEDLKKRDALLDGCRDLARGNLQGLFFAEPLYEFLTPLDLIFPQVFETENENRLRQAACHLVGIGKGLHPDYRADLVFEDVLYAPLAGLTHKERAYLALILFHSYTGRVGTTNQDAINLLLTLRERQAALVFGSAIRLAVVASGRSGELLTKLDVSAQDQIISLSAKPGWENMLTERVAHRLTKLAQLINYKINI